MRINFDRVASNPGFYPIGANITGPCIDTCVFVVEALADVATGPPGAVAGKRGLARA